MNLLSLLLRLFFRLLYHPFAWTYGLVAWTVSLGRWRYWGESVIPFIEGNHILELGHGPGNLQCTLLDRQHDSGQPNSLLIVGLDESRQMGQLAKKHLSQHGYAQPCIVRGLAQGLPFAAETFETVVATFPTEYIFEEQTLSEVKYVLRSGGRLVVLPVAWVTGHIALDRFAAWLFRVTGQAPSDPVEIVCENLKEPFQRAGFRVIIEQLEVKSSLLLIVIAQKNHYAQKTT